MAARPKPKPKTAVGERTENADRAVELRDVKEENKNQEATTKMTSEVKQVPKKPESKAMPHHTPPAEVDQPTPKPREETATTYAMPAGETPPVGPIGQSEHASDNLWAYYQGTGRDVRDPQGDPQYVEVAGTVVRIPTPPQPSRREGEDVAGHEEVPNPGKVKGHGQSKGKWRPILNPQGTYEDQGRGGNRSRCQMQPSEPSSSYGKGKEKGSSKGKGKKGKGGKNKQVWTYTEEYVPTDLWGKCRKCSSRPSALFSRRL